MWAQKSLLVETESFTNKGGWVVDQQYFDIIGSSYLMAHGMGEVVKDAKTKVTFPEKGKYKLWVRTKDWAPFPKGPGKFKLKIGNDYIEEFGSTGKEGWHWYDGGTITIDNPENVSITLQDLTGFNGRCDAIYFSKSKKDVPPAADEDQLEWRRAKLGLDKEPHTIGNFDMVVVGGGMGGLGTALSAARNGLKVALIQNRPVLGGNNSSEIRVHLMGHTTWDNKYPRLGRITRELDNGDPKNANPNGKLYGDKRKMMLVKQERNIELFLNMHAYDVEMDGNNIKAVIARDINTNRELRFEGRFFADCTGDATIGFKAGADYRVGRESRAQTGESLAPEKADNFALGSSNLWHASDMGEASSFPETPWALQFSDDYYLDTHKSTWVWETGFKLYDPILEAEKIRDHNFRAIYGNWSYLKNHKAEKYGNYKFDWVAYIAGKRESRKLMGDYIFTQMDIDGSKTPEDDAMVVCTWSIDLHFPDSLNSAHFPGEEFISATIHHKYKPYHIPYRCLYSRNIDNLYMAGRNISTTHVAFGSTRIMNSICMMGELIGYAAGLAKKYNTTPRGVYENHLEELKEMLR